MGLKRRMKYEGHIVIGEDMMIRACPSLDQRTMLFTLEDGTKIRAIFEMKSVTKLLDTVNDVGDPVYMFDANTNITVFPDEIEQKKVKSN